MDISPRDICDAGVKAVQDGKEIWGIENVDGIREEFTSALIALNLHKTLRLPVRTERLYSDVYKKLGLDISYLDIANKI